MSGIIPSNASGIPLMLQAAEPPYGWDHTGSAPLVDDYGRLFPGNTLANSSELFTQCWNATDQPAGQVNADTRQKTGVFGVCLLIPTSCCGSTDLMNAELWVLTSFKSWLQDLLLLPCHHTYNIGNILHIRLQFDAACC